MLIYVIGYFWVPYLISGIFRHFRYVKWKILHFFAIERDISGYIACSYIARYIYLYSQQEMVIEDLWPFGERGGRKKHLIQVYILAPKKGSKHCILSSIVNFCGDVSFVPGFGNSPIQTSLHFMLGWSMFDFSTF